MTCDARTGIVAKNFFFSPLAPPYPRACALSLRQPPPAVLLARRPEPFWALSATACVPTAFVRAVSSVLCATSAAASAAANSACADATAVVFAAPVKTVGDDQRLLGCGDLRVGQRRGLLGARTAFCARARSASPQRASHVQPERASASSLVSSRRSPGSARLRARSEKRTRSSRMSAAL